MQRVIVCAAVRNCSENKIIVGVHHHDEHMNNQISEIGLWHWDDIQEEGFLDNKGSFLSRTEAWKVAEAAGQIKRRCGGDTADGGTLFSENLY